MLWVPTALGSASCKKEPVICFLYEILPKRALSYCFGFGLDRFAIFCGVSLRVHVAYYVLPFFFVFWCISWKRSCKTRFVIGRNTKWKSKFWSGCVYTLIMLCTYLDLRLLCVVYQRIELPDNAQPRLQLMSYAESLKGLCSCPLFLLGTSLIL